MTKDCPFCQIAVQGLPSHGLYEDEAFFILLDRGSLGPAHCMLVPKHHVPQIHELTGVEYEELFLLAKRLAPCLQEAVKSRAVGYVAFGSGLPHAHLHLVPHNDPKELESPQPRTLSESELQANAARLRTFVSKCLLSPKIRADTSR